MLKFHVALIRTGGSRRSLLLVPFLALALAVAAPACADGYLAALEDVPLMPGLEEVADAGLEFEAATGRIVEAVAIGAKRPGLDRGAVLAFYGSALPQLGWRPVTALSFVRESEVLELTVEEVPGRVTVRFGLKPR